ncbi:MAG: hypothetical protein K9H84_05615, partial [Bacteroidales bacterium]|nr:hypothetical protein [Bacteroidales bacterium]
SNPFAEAKDFVFQIDTTPDFSSPVFLSTTIQSKGGVIEWMPPLTLQDSVVYYWRVSIDSVNTGNYDWRRSSFQYINSKTGWAQAHFPQFNANEYQYINQDFTNRKFRFINLTNEIFVKTGVYPHVDVYNVSFSINNDVRRFWTCLKQHPDYIGMLFVVFDTLSGEPFLSRASAIKPNGLGEYNNVHCSSGDLPTIEFFTNSTVGWSKLYEAPQSWWFNTIVNFIDSLPNGTPVLAYSAQNHNAENYTNQLYQAFESIGSSYIRTINNDEPYIIFGKKGYNIGDAHESVGSGPLDKISLTDSVKSRWKNGYIKSPIIGPSKKWKSLHWDYSYSDSIHMDYIEFDVIGIKNDGTVDTVINNLPLDSTDVNSLDNYVTANNYPWIQLIMKTRDDSLNTPAQLKKWQVIYAGAPETAINPQKGFSFYNDTLLQGDTVRMSIATENISNYDMDSLKVKYWIVDHNRIEQPISEYKLRPHPSGDVLIDTISFDTRDLKNLNRLWVEFNPDNDQLELTHINNIAELPFYVKTDESNPLLDVTFDGVHIMDGDIVSARPHILITLKDENKYLALEDTSNISVFLKIPSQQSYKKLNFNSQGVDELIFHPASLPENECKIEYQGDFQEDGIYNLRVQAKDESGNKSGNIDYDINFEVVNKSTITNVLNWPNPFSTRTHFVFTLTGSRVPDYMKIQIMTVTGKVVREIEMDEMGPVHIGKNITEYAWDGTDEFGDRLANGVYLYRVITDMNGESIEKRDSAADQFFRKGFGKMYLIR